LHDLAIFDVSEPQGGIDFNSYATPTPAIEEGRVYLHFGSPGTACLDTRTGAIVWTRQDLPCNHYRGPASSPILWNDLMILTFDGFDHQYVAALSKHSGETVWKMDRNIDYGGPANDDGDMKKSFSTPAVGNVNGVPTVVSTSAGATLAYDVRDGRELWRAKTGGTNSACRPIFFEDMVIGQTSGGMRIFALRIDGRGDITDTHVVWTYSKSTPTRPSQIIVGELLFMISSEGVVTCLEARTGKEVWQKRLEGDYSASPLSAAGRIYFFNEDGLATVIAAERRFKMLAESKLEQGFMASPAVVDDALILRTRTHLYRMESQ
jgi:outer membrane protein assembly factor BamB